MEKRLTRDVKNKKIAGVCAGIANYFDLDPTFGSCYLDSFGLCGRYRCLGLLDCLGGYARGLIRIL